MIAVALGYLLRVSLREFLYARLTADMFVAQDVDDFDPGPALGSRFPGIRAHYQGGSSPWWEEFAGPRALCLSPAAHWTGVPTACAR